MFLHASCHLEPSAVLVFWVSSSRLIARGSSQTDSTLSKFTLLHNFCMTTNILIFCTSLAVHINSSHSRVSPLFTDLTLGSSTHFLWLLYMKSVLLDDFISPLGKALSPFAFLSILPIQCQCLQSIMWGIMIPKCLPLALCFQFPFWKFLQTCPHWPLSFGFLYSSSPWHFVLHLTLNMHHKGTWSFTAVKGSRSDLLGWVNHWQRA